MRLRRRKLLRVGIIGCGPRGLEHGDAVTAGPRLATLEVVLACIASADGGRPVSLPLRLP